MLSLGAALVVAAAAVGMMLLTLTRLGSLNDDERRACGEVGRGRLRCWTTQSKEGSLSPMLHRSPRSNRLMLAKTALSSSSRLDRAQRSGCRDADRHGSQVAERAAAPVAPKA